MKYLQIYLVIMWDYNVRENYLNWLLFLDLVNSIYAAVFLSKHSIYTRK